MLITHTRPQVLGTMAYTDAIGTGHCIFLARDPDLNHFTARVRWQDDPGRIQDFSTFIRNDAASLVPAETYFEDPTLSPLKLFIGDSLLANIAGKSSCEVIVSNGILFSSARSHGKQNQQTAKKDLHDLARGAKPPRDTSAAQFAASMASQIDSELEKAPFAPKLSFYSFRAGEKWRITTHAHDILSCVGHSSFCDNVTIENSKIAINNTTIFAPGRAFLTLSLKKMAPSYNKDFGNQKEISFLVIDILNPAFSPNYATLPKLTSCPKIIDLVLAGDLPPGIAAFMKNTEGDIQPISRWSSLSNKEREKWSCNIKNH